MSIWMQHLWQLSTTEVRPSARLHKSNGYASSATIRWPSSFALYCRRERQWTRHSIWQLHFLIWRAKEDGHRMVAEDAYPFDLWRRAEGRTSVVLNCHRCCIQILIHLHVEDFMVTSLFIPDPIFLSENDPNLCLRVLENLTAERLVDVSHFCRPTIHWRFFWEFSLCGRYHVCTTSIPVEE